MKLRNTKYPKNIETVKLLLSLDVTVDDAFSLCNYTESQKEKKKHLVQDTLKLLELNKKLDDSCEQKEDVQVTISVESE